MNVQGEIAIAELEPVGCADLAELVERVPTFARESPSAFAIAETGEGVEERVVIWADRKPMQLKVITRVSNDA